MKLEEHILKLQNSKNSTEKENFHLRNQLAQIERNVQEMERKSSANNENNEIATCNYSKEIIKLEKELQQLEKSRKSAEKACKTFKEEVYELENLNQTYIENINDLNEENRTLRIGTNDIRKYPWKMLMDRYQGGQESYTCSGAEEQVQDEHLGHFNDFFHQP